MAVLETIKIQSDDTEAGYLIINARDFDANIHKPYEPQNNRNETPEAAAPATKTGKK